MNIQTIAICQPLECISCPISGLHIPLWETLSEEIGMKLPKVLLPMGLSSRTPNPMGGGGSLGEAIVLREVPALAIKEIVSDFVWLLLRSWKRIHTEEKGGE